MMTPEHVYIFRFGKHKLNNRVIIRYSHTWTGRLKINEIDVRLHHQHHPRIFKTERDLIIYLTNHLEKKRAQEAAKPGEEASAQEAPNWGYHTKPRGRGKAICAGLLST